MKGMKSGTPDRIRLISRIRATRPRIGRCLYGRFCAILAQQIAPRRCEARKSALVSCPPRRPIIPRSTPFMPDIDPIRQAAAERGRQMKLPYAGALLPAEAHAFMQAGGKLVD